ncbi:MAG: response regulator [Elusimicrobia bacterium]|nr:response regulator [Elusimicrobiota bacterium]
MNEDPQKKGCVVLVVEDDEAISEFLSLTLEQEGYEVCVAPDGIKGLEIILSRKPVAVLLDLMLPGVDGLTILRRLAETAETAAIPVMVVSSYADAGDTRKALDASPNVKKIFVKPILTENLLKSVKLLIAGR